MPIWLHTLLHEKHVDACLPLSDMKIRSIRKRQVCGVQSPGVAKFPQVAIWRLCFACWIPKSTNTPSEYCFSTAALVALILRYTHINLSFFLYSFSTFFFETFFFPLYSAILSVLDPRKCEYLKDYSFDFEHTYMTTYFASWEACRYLFAVLWHPDVIGTTTGVWRHVA